MARAIRYGKPNMTNLPPELGRAIFEQMLNTPPSDLKKMKEEADMLEKKMKEEMEKYLNEHGNDEQ